MRLGKLQLFALAAFLLGAVTASAQVADPTLQVSGVNNTSQTVTITVTDSTSGATLYYTTDGTQPTTSSSTVASGGTVSLSSTMVFKVEAVSGSFTSSIITAQYTNLGLITSSGDHTTVINKDGTISAMGNNGSGQLGTGGTSPSNLPTQTLASPGMPFSGAYPVRSLVTTTQAVRLILLAGSGQSGTPGSLASAPLVIQVINNSTGANVSGVPVIFTVGQGGGLISTSSTGPFAVTASATTDSTGRAQVYFVYPNYGNIVGYVAAAAVNQAVTFTETSQPIAQVLNTTGPVPATPRNSIMAGGTNHSVVLNFGGTVSTSGDNSFGQLGNGTFTSSTLPVVVSGLSNVVAVAAGQNFCVALKSNGGAVTWGDGQFGQLGNGSSGSGVKSNVPVTVPGFGNVVAIAAGETHAMLLRSDGTVWAWGTNTNGELGNGTTTASASPVQVTGLSGVIAIAAGLNHSAALLSNGTVVAWGLNSDGELGNGSTTSSSTFVAVSSLTNVVAIVAGTHHCEALKADGTVWGWGHNASDELGNGNTTGQTTPVQVSSSSSLPGVIAIASYGTHTSVVTNGGVVWSWGTNTSGELGNGTTTSSTVPVNTGLLNVTAVGAGLHHTMALVPSITGVSQVPSFVGTWGNNASGQLGLGSSSNQTLPQVSAFANAGSEKYMGMFGGAYHTLAVQLNGTLFAWGDNGQGQLGNGSVINSTSPILVNGLNQVATAAAGGYHSLAVKTDGTVRAWGFNQFGQLGDGTTTQRTLPVTVSSLANITAVAAGYEHSVALRSDGTVWAWGYNADGELGNGSTTNSSTPVQVSSLTGIKAIATRGHHSLALRGDGTIWAWGYNGQGQLGNGTTTSSSTPVQVSGITNAVAIAGGGYFSAAIEADGTVWTWGDNTYGQLGDGTTTNRLSPVQAQYQGLALNSAVQLALGDNHTLVLQVFGSLIGFGANYSGQLTNGNTTNQNTGQLIIPSHSVSSIAAGAIDSLANAVDGSGSFGWGDNSLGQLGNSNSPLPTNFPGLKGAVIAAGGGGFFGFGNQSAATVALRTDGSVWCWGYAGSGQMGNGTSASSNSTPVKAFNLSGIVSVASGYYHFVALKNDGTVWTWGSGDAGQLGYGTNPKETAYPTEVGLYAVNSIGAGALHTLVTRTDGSVWAWGDNIYGDIGDGTTTKRTFPAHVIGLPSMVAVAGGIYHSIGLSNTGTVYAWGNNAQSQLGNGSTTNSATPVSVSGLSNIVAVASGGFTSYALDSSGNVYAWGYNGDGEIGNGTTTNATTPVHLTALSGIVAIAAGDFHAIAIKNDGSVWTWGQNANGELGNGGTGNVTTPTKLTSSLLTGIVAAAASGYHTVVEKADGSILSWGDNTYGELGNGTNTNTTSPTANGFNLNGRIYALAVGDAHSEAVRNDGTLWSWGNNNKGQLGLGTTTNQSAPMQVAAQTNVTGVAAGTTFSSSVTTDGKVWVWGNNTSGQLGNGTTQTSLGPVSPASSTLQSSAGSAHTVTLRSDHTIWTFGANGSGQLGNGGTTASSTSVEVNSSTLNGDAAQVSAGSLHSVALKRDGTIWTWGSNVSGQLGNGNNTQQNSPIQLTGLSGVFTAVAAGGSHTIALKANGTVWTWGFNADGELGNGGTTNNSTPAQIASLTNIVAIAATATNSYALRSDGAVFAWGAGTAGQLGNGGTSRSTTPVQITTLSQIIALGTGSSANHMLAMDVNGNVWGWGDNVNGDIGDGTSTQRNSPVQVSGFNLLQYPNTPVLSTAATVAASGSNVTLNVNLADRADPIKQVDFYQGTTLIGTTTTFPYALSWTNVAPGTYTVTAVVTDINSVTTTTAAVRVKVMRPGYDSVVANKNDAYAVRSDGTIWSWGQNSSGELGVGSMAGQMGPTWVEGVSNAVSMAAGGFHALALTSSGTVWTWGDNNDGDLGLGTTGASSVPQQISSLSNIIQVAAGDNHGAALASDGTVWTWGDNSSGQLGTGNNTSSSVPVQVPPGTLNSIVAIDARGNSTMALRADGTVWEWGNNSNGQLGNGTTTNSNVPVQVSTISNVGSITLCGLHAGAVTNTGAVYTWGKNTNGQLGNGSTTDSSTPVLISSLTSITSLRCGPASTFAIKSDGTIYSFGNNASGQLGLGSATTQFTTPQTASLWAGAVQFSGSTNDTIALNASGTVWMAGSQSNGQLGNGIQSSTNATSPGQVYTLYGTLGLANGDGHTVSFRNDGTVWSWGSNNSGQLGNGTTTASSSPVQASVNNNAVAVAAGTGFSLSLGSNGAVSAWGLNNHGQLGVSSSSYPTRANPAIVPGLGNAIQVSAGAAGGAALKGDGTVWMWGRGTEGELGNGTSSDSITPVQAQASGFSGLIQVAAGNQHVVALKSDGTVWTWGSNSNGQLGNNSTTNSSTPVQLSLSGIIAVGAGTNFSLALKNDGTVWAWGYNGDGELGNGTTTQSLVPTQVTSLSSDVIVAIATAGGNAFALQNNGTLWTWGLNGNGQLGNGTTTSSSSAVQVTGITTSTAGVTGLASGSSALHSLALIGNSAIYGWGDNSNGDLGDGTTTQRTSPVLSSTVSSSPPLVAPTITLTEPDGAVQF